jgi:hypothetical protein
MRNPRVEEVIITENELRGNGTPESPYRRILQVWTKQGDLIAEHDSMLDGVLQSTVSDQHHSNNK